MESIVFFKCLSFNGVALATVEDSSPSVINTTTISAEIINHLPDT